LGPDYGSINCGSAADVDEGGVVSVQRDILNDA
jgi:hypothetical protein